MKNIKQLYNRLVSANSNWSSGVKSRVKLAVMMLRIVPLIYGNLSVSTVKIVYGFAGNAVKLHAAQGPKGLAKYLKACYVLLQQSIGGFKIPAPWDLGCNVSRTSRGVPRIMNPQQRLLALQGDVPTIRLWLSLFGLYRVVEFKGSLKLKTITNPGKEIPSSFWLEWREWIPNFLEAGQIASGLSWKVVPSKDLTPYLIPNIRKSSPNSGGLASVAAFPLDLVRWALEPRYLAKVFAWLKAVDGLEMIWGLKPFVKRIEDHLREQKGPKVTPLMFLKGHINWGIPVTSSLFSVWWSVTTLGKVGFKEEPGKIRVFAMVDILTQALMLPLHKWLFSRLRPLSTDGTFDQIAPVERLIKRMQDTNKTFVASYDLSAATDRLPVALQEMILEQVMGSELSRLWVDLLVGRSYRLPRIARSYNLGFDSVRYAVGQPMGAYSSWAMLAMTHHAIVQLAAFRVKRVREWFVWYAVLGDDIVIADKDVAQEYLRIMELIGVEIGLAKSLVSNNLTLEFAKRTYVRGTDVSPISLMEVSVAQSHLGSLEELVRKNLKFGKLRLASVARFAGFGYRVLAQLPVGFALGNRCGRLSAFLHRPGGVWSMSLQTWLTAVGPGGKVRHPQSWWAAAYHLWEVILQALIKKVTRFEALLPFGSLYNYSVGEYRPLKKGEDNRGDGLRAKKGYKFISSYLTDGGPLINDISVSAFNEFFREWVTHPYTEALRKVFSRIDDKLRVLSPHVLPTWSDIEEIWELVMEDEEGGSLLPNKITFLVREDEVKPSSSKILDLWRVLSRKAKTYKPGNAVVEGYVDPPEAERRWARGLGQDRLFMDTTIVWNEFAREFERRRASAERESKSQTTK